MYVCIFCERSNMPKQNKIVIIIIIIVIMIKMK